LAGGALAGVRSAGFNHERRLRAFHVEDDRKNLRQGSKWRTCIDRAFHASVAAILGSWPWAWIQRAAALRRSPSAWPCLDRLAVFSLGLAVGWGWALLSAIGAADSGPDVYLIRPTITCGAAGRERAWGRAALRSRGWLRGRTGLDHTHEQPRWLAGRLIAASLGGKSFISHGHRDLQFGPAPGSVGTRHAFGGSDPRPFSFFAWPTHWPMGLALGQSG